MTREALKERIEHILLDPAKPYEDKRGELALLARALLDDPDSGSIEDTFEFWNSTMVLVVEEHGLQGPIN